MRPKSKLSMRLICNLELRNGKVAWGFKGRRVFQRIIRVDVCPPIQIGHSDKKLFLIIALFLIQTLYLNSFW